MDTLSGFERTADIPVLKQPMTTRQIDGEVLVDEDMKKKWDEAEDEKETITTITAINEMVLHELNQAIDYAMSDLAQLVERFDRLSLAGSYSAQMRTLVRFLEGMEKRTAEREEWENVKESLDHVKRRLELLNKVEDAKKGVLQEQVAYEACSSVSHTGTGHEPL